MKRKILILILLTSLLDFGNAYKFTGGDSCIDNDKQCDFLEQISLKDSCTSSNCKSEINKERVWFYGHEFNTNKVFVHANGHTTFGDEEIDFGTKSSFGQATMRSYGSRGFPYVNLPYFKCFSDEMIEIIEYEFYWTLSDDCRHEAQEVQEIIDEYFDEEECKTYFEVIWKTCVREDSTIHDDFSSIIVSSTDYTLIINHYENLSEINAEVLVVGVAGGEFTKSWFSFDINQTENADHKATLFLGSLQKSSNMVGERKGYWAWSSEQQEEQETPKRFGSLDNLKPEDAQQLIDEVEDIMDKIDVSEEKFDLVLPNLLISVDLMSRYVTFGDTSIVTRSTLPDSTFKCGLAEEARLDLGSKSLIPQLNSIAENRVKCAIFANASIFATNASQTTTGEAISFSIGDYKIEDLNRDDRIQLVFSRDSTRRGANRNWDTCNYWDIEAQEWTDSGCIKDVRQSTKDKTVCKCNHFTNFAALYTPFRDEDSIPEAHNLNMTTYIVSALSIACLLATLGIHLWFEKLRSNAQKRILISLCFALLGRDACILAIGFSGTGLASCECKDAYFKAYAGNDTESSCGLIEKRNDTIGDSIGDVVEAYRIGDDEWMKLRYEMNYCPQLVTAAAFAQYFITAVFFWMACEGVHLYYSVAVVLNKPRSKYITKLSVVGWGMPLLFTVIVLIVEATTGKGYKLNFEYARDEAIETNFWIFLDDTMDQNFYVEKLSGYFFDLFLIPYFIMVMFGMVLSALINSQSNVVKTFQRISNFLSMKPDEKRKPLALHHQNCPETYRTTQQRIIRNDFRE
ncbi:Oidioi.mRNA.OKI2018_I69.PAR.g10468.t1.cds [Oikopleura dioica]|uniref:Oidioi.mRNA.OKI2018_I69.PAR.g10468.t1.cds n=1 Tax=Oikopleura dioica TaxID=34765 RepID=A0ABN7RRN3_OIKDI|nr:Oidioi.mRNA.OKI2018_I69.PAR.g10468.t1.cds [Oikopleura dioica]